MGLKIVAHTDLQLVHTHSVLLSREESSQAKRILLEIQSEEKVKTTTFILILKLPQEIVEITITQEIISFFNLSLKKSLQGHNDTELSEGATNFYIIFDFFGYFYLGI